MINYADYTTSTATVAEYRIDDIRAQNTRSFITEATCCALQRDAMLTRDQMITLDADLRAYIEEEASRRGVDIMTVYEEEMAARARLAQRTPRNADLLLLADRFPAPQAWYDE